MVRLNHFLPHLWPGEEGVLVEHLDQGDGWIAYVEEIPGANTQGDTLDEARENLKEAVSMVLEANRELAERQLTGKDVPLKETFKGVMPFLASDFLRIALLLFFPAISLVLVRSFHP